MISKNDSKQSPPYVIPESDKEVKRILSDSAQ